MGKEIKYKQDFINMDFEACVEQASELSDDQQTDIIDCLPHTKEMFVGLILLVKAQKRQKFNVDDWECDLANHIWPEIQRTVKKQLK